MTQTKNRNLDPNALNAQGHILWFDDLGTGNEEYRFLSNFYEGEPITLPGVTWEALLAADAFVDRHVHLHALTGSVGFATGEHAFAAMKFWGSDAEHFFDIVHASGPNPAKVLGRSRKHPLRADWEVVKLDVMAAVTRAKYTLDREEGKRLLETGDRLLVEGNFWGDEVWGVALDVEGVPGRNWLGTLLMARRAELRAAQAYADEDRYVQHFVGETVYHNSEFSL